MQDVKDLLSQAVARSREKCISSHRAAHEVDNLLRAAQAQLDPTDPQQQTLYERAKAVVEEELDIFSYCLE